MSNAERAPLTADRLRELLDYDPDTGVFRWKVSRGRLAKAGAVAGTDSGQGYLAIKVDNRLYKSHRLAWLHATGAWPVDMIDHINGVRNDNRLSNLRPATNSQNRANSGVNLSNATGHKGVTFHRSIGAFQAQISKDGKKKHLGYFSTPEDAHAAYCAAAQTLHGEFARTS